MGWAIVDAATGEPWSVRFLRDALPSRCNPQDRIIEVTITPYRARGRKARGVKG